MGRKRTAWVVLLLALTVAVVIPSLTSKHIAGTATVTPPAPPPAVGDCIVEPFEADSLMTSTPAGWKPEYSYPSTGSCRGTVYGQITAIIAHPELTTNDSGADGNYTRCPHGSRHEGLPAGSDTGKAYGHWYVSLLATTLLIGPSPRQTAAGARWAACVITVTADQGNLARGLDAPVSQWRHSRQVAGAIGQCLLVTSPGLQPSPDCTITHAAESFGVTTGPLTPELIASCRALVGDLTGMTDPTAGGRLLVEVLTYDMDNTQVTHQQRSQATSSQVCMVNGNHRSYLTGSLLALGTQPVPFG